MGNCKCLCILFFVINYCLSLDGISSSELHCFSLLVEIINPYFFYACLCIYFYSKVSDSTLIT
jgi:hypothetical protein